jgi:HAD superfamily hydrolase (TIGR01490 family)
MTSERSWGGGTGEQERPLAVFDLDGTLARGDTLLPFLFGYCRHHRWWTRRAGLAIDLTLYASRAVSARLAKERMIRRILGGERIEQVAGYAARFCREWLPSRTHQVGVAALRHHQRAGHRVALLSASPDVYVHAVAQWFEIPEVVCTRVARTTDRIDGSIIGDNCKGQAKVAMLTRYLCRETSPAESYGYADAQSDRPVLTWVRTGYWVGSEGSGALIPVGGA